MFVKIGRCICLSALLSVTFCDDYRVDYSHGLGRRFDGIGGLSGGGATSKLLVNYPKDYRDQILDYLFKPNFAASLQILKVEIGGDSQSTEGTEASHMHNEWDENYQRGYEWWLMTEAKKRNPDILLYGLPWAFPGWLGDGGDNPYTNVTRTAEYVTRWLLGAKKFYNLSIDYIGIWNERPYDISYIKTLRKSLDTHQLSHVKIVGADGGWEIASAIEKDSELAAAVDYIGAHYPGTTTSSEALTTGKQLWSSEDYSTYNDNTGAGCWARILNQNFVNGFMTSTISWNLIASYYSALPYPGCGLMTADNPWTGHYDVSAPIWITAHTTQFTAPGWSYLQHGSGVGKLTHGGSYVSLVSPDHKDLTVIIETMSHDHSLCIRPALPAYNVIAQNVTLQLRGVLAKFQQLNVWYSKLAFGKNETSVLFKKLSPVKVQDGRVTLSVGVDELYTLTSLPGGTKGTYPAPPARKPFPNTYSEDFEAFPDFSEPFNFAQQVGSFEVTRSNDASHGQVLRQVVLKHPIFWCPFPLITPINLIGRTWSDVYMSADIAIGPVNGTTGVFVAARVDQGGCQSWKAKGIFFFLFPSEKKFILTNDLARTMPLKEGEATGAVQGWNSLALLLEGSNAVGRLNKQTLFNITVPSTPAHGFVAIGTDSYGIADFDNVQIKGSGSH
ncbi:galactocerebrosidase-like isoform X2 [Mizuhopecten yessoensis]|uniref:galactocerebrosidase-like isoform X2 n=1 Tax=Mizuhopecten yessoensis TaxID=6573 RepID=UPI000B45CE58|nr:galactocerebrosidase-like isoform X2 [Mizuhopecten yessoensis]